MTVNVATVRTPSRRTLSISICGGVFDRGESEVLGGSGLHTRVGHGALEIGYWLRVSALGRGLAREATAALTVAALRVCRVDRVEIHVDPANERSVEVPRALGYAEEATLRRRLPAGGDGAPRDMVVFTLFADQLDSSPLGEVGLEGYDVLGRAIPI